MWFGKRLFDLFFAVIGLLVLWPLFLLIIILIRLTDRGSVFFKQSRVGYKGQIFEIIKFRTMTTDTDKKHILITAANDSRVTRVGKILRATKLDELPQLINVLKSEMSFVGPRPEVEKYISLLPLVEKNKILSLKPGVTDFASIEFCQEGDLLNASLDPERLYVEEILPRKIELSLRYFEVASFFTDVKIIFKTLQRIL